MKLFDTRLFIALIVISSNLGYAATRWTPKSASEAEQSISFVFAPSQEIEVEFDGFSEDVELDFYGFGIDLGSFYFGGVIVTAWGDDLSDDDGLGFQFGFKRELYRSDPLSLDLDVKGLYFDLSSDELDAEYNEVTAGVMAKYTKDNLVFWGGLDVVLHSDFEAKNKPFDDRYDGEADSRINFMLGVGYHTEKFIADAGVGLFGYEGLILSAGLKF